MTRATAIVRQFLSDHFSDDDLDALAFDFFPDVAGEFTGNMTRSRKIQLLLASSEREPERWRRLLDALKKKRPEPFRQRLEDVPNTLPTSGVPADESLPQASGEAPAPSIARVSAATLNRPAEGFSGAAADVGIVVPLREEFQELHNEIKSYCSTEKDPRTGKYYYHFERAGRDGQKYRCVATFVGEMGELQAGLLTARLLETWQPTTVVVLGIAAGISDDVMVGDVVAATVVDSYLQNSKAVDSASGEGFAFKVSGEPFRASKDLIEEVKNLPFAYGSIYSTWQQAAAGQLAEELDETARREILQQKLVRE